MLLYRWDTSVYFHIMTNMFLPLFHQLLYYIFSENLCIWLGIAVNLVYPSTCQRIKKWNRPYLNRIYSIGSYLSILAHPKKKKKKKNHCSNYAFNNFIIYFFFNYKKSSANWNSNIMSWFLIFLYKWYYLQEGKN